MKNFKLEDVVNIFSLESSNDVIYQVYLKNNKSLYLSEKEFYQLDNKFKGDLAVKVLN